jgi:peroxiredoxin
VIRDLLSGDPSGALGVKAPGGFRLSEIPGDVLLLEFFSSRCPTCQRQAPQLDGVFRAVSSGALAGRVRVIAIGAGDSRRDLEAFQQDQRVSYPLVPDPWFDLYGQLGSLPRSPVTLFLRKQAGRWVQADALQGRADSSVLLERAKQVLEGQDATSAAAPGEGAAPYDPPLGLDEARQQAKALVFLSGIDPSVRAVAVVGLSGGMRVYRALRAGGNPVGLYARFASREPVCDVCHAVHFLLAFDEAGSVRGFEPIHVAKVGNQPLSPDEEALLRSRLVGRKMQELRFEPTVDSVTGATLSASVIFDEARRTARLLSQLQAR